MAYGRFAAAGLALAAIDDPAQHAQIFSKPRPEKFSSAVLSEPIDVKDLRRGLQFGTDVDPMRPVIAEVIAGERLHGHGIPPNHADGLCGRCRRFRRDAGPDQYSVQPIARLVYERRERAPAAAEHNPRGGHATR